MSPKDFIFNPTLKQNRLLCNFSSISVFSFFSILFVCLFLPSGKACGTSDVYHVNRLRMPIISKLCLLQTTLFGQCLEKVLHPHTSPLNFFLNLLLCLSGIWTSFFCFVNCVKLQCKSYNRFNINSVETLSRNIVLI